MIREQCKLKILKYNPESEDSKANDIIILSSLRLRIKVILRVFMEYLMILLSKMGFYLGKNFFEVNECDDE